MMTVILISGKAESGKTTLCNILADEFKKDGFRVIIPSFANYLKYIASKYLGWNGKKDEAGRMLLQELGTDIIRKKEPDFWSQSVLSLLNVLDDLFDVAIIDDVRFANEMSVFTENDNYRVFSIRIERPNHKNSLSDLQRNHISETELDDYREFNYTIVNKEGLDNLVEASNGLYSFLIGNNKNE